MGVARDQGQGRNGELTFDGYRVSIGENENVIAMDDFDGCTKCECTESH